MTDHHEDSWGDRPGEDGLAENDVTPALRSDENAFNHSPDLGEQREPGGADTRLGDLGGQSYGTPGSVTVPLTGGLPGGEGEDHPRPEDEVDRGGPREPDELGRFDPLVDPMSNDNR